MDRLDILQDGDIVLAVSGSLELRVSSVVLSMTSPVFRTMLGPHFAEGHALRRKTTGVPHVVTLPDDDAKLMKALCLISHHQPRAVQVPDCGAAFIVDMVALADKYGCLDILKLPATQWAAAISIVVLDQMTQMKCAEAAFKLDDAQFFDRCTRTLVLGGIEDSEQYLPYASTFHRILISALEKTKARTFSHLKSLIDKLVEYMGSAVDPDSSHYNEVQGAGGYLDCEFNSAAVGTYLHTLSKARMWPSSCRTACLGLLLINIQSLQSPEITLAEPCSDCRSESLLKAFEREMCKLQGVSQDLFTPVCLDCLKGTSDAYIACRIPHHGFWESRDRGGDQRLHYDCEELVE
ncbi:hypothetical protein LTR17_008673 [Elasticomyces elasticus]|nr:hypothetical protein LTR17_008673 [Elasticomyces elasticus]